MLGGRCLREEHKGMGEGLGNMRVMTDEMRCFCRWRGRRGEDVGGSPAIATVLGRPSGDNECSGLGFRWNLVFSCTYYCGLFLSFRFGSCLTSEPDLSGPNPRILWSHQGSPNRRLSSTVPALFSPLFLSHRDVFVLGDMVGSIIG